jgi:hypothetical protein
MIDCEQGEYLEGGSELLHPLGEGAVVTPEGIFCSQVCANKAYQEAQMEIGLEDADSWYFLHE